MANLLLLLARRIAAILKAYFARVSADGGTVVDRGHTEVVYNDVQALNPLLIQTCDGGSADDLYSLFAFDDIDDLQLRVVADSGTNVDVGQNAKVAQHLWRYNLHNDASIVVPCASNKAGRLYAYQPTVEPDTTRIEYYIGSSAAAYSLRSLSTSTTNVVKVRRSGDDAELDFTASEVSGGTLAAWVVAGGGTEDGFVVTWYDQSGNGNNATQATAASQPTIVSSGTLVTENGKAAVLFDGTDDGLNANGFNQGLNDFATFAIINISEADDWCAVANGTSRANEGGFMIFGESANRYRAVFWTNTASQTAATSSVTKAGQVLQSIIGDRDNLLSQYLNGTFGSSTDISSYSNVDLVNNGDLTIGYGFSFLNRYCNTPIQEIIIYNSDQSANRTGIEATINDYYNIYS